jgi:hypothetical protein
LMTLPQARFTSRPMLVLVKLSQLMHLPQASKEQCNQHPAQGKLIFLTLKRNSSTDLL